MGDPATTNLIVVDDDAAVLGALQFLFEVEGYEVHAYACAESLLREPDFPDCGCMVLDYRLPGLNGLQLLDEMRGRGVTLPAVLITTPTAAVRAQAAAAGVVLVEKPLLSRTLLDVVTGLLNSDSPAAA